MILISFEEKPKGLLLMVIVNDLINVENLNTTENNITVDLKCSPSYVG